MVNSLVYRLVRRPGGVLPDRQLFRVVLSTWRAPPSGTLRPACRNDKYPWSYGNPTAALSPVRAAILRFRQLRRDRQQDDQREAGYLRDLGTDPQIDDAGACVEDLERIILLARIIGLNLTLTIGPIDREETVHLFKFPDN